MTNLIRKLQGDNIWAGYKCFRVLFDSEGNLHKGGAKYAVFRDGWLVGEEDSQTEADKAFLQNPAVGKVKLSEYKGIDRRLR